MSHKKKIKVVVGGAGFIGSNLLDELSIANEGGSVIVIDNFSMIKQENSLIDKKNNILFYKADVADENECKNAFKYAATFGGIDEVWHLAANSDIPAGISDPQIDLKDTFMTTFQILQVMKLFDIKNFLFASSSAIYGDLGGQILHEKVGPLHPISNYGAMKLASEAQATAALESYLEKVFLFRFPNVIGTPATHGVILDFVRKLKNNPKELHVLGDGTQKKSYLHVTDLINAMLTIALKGNERLNVYNIGPIDDGVTVKWIAENVVKRISPTASIKYGRGNKGWVGDVPRFRYSTEKIISLGWKPMLGSKEAVLRAIDEIAVQERM